MTHGSRWIEHLASGIKPDKLRVFTGSKMKLTTVVTPALAGLLLIQNAAFTATVPVPPPPNVQARSYVLVDHDSGRTLAESNSEQRLDPASITKLMTAYVVFHALKDGKLTLKETVNVSEHAWKAEGSRTFVQVGTQVPVDVLIQGHDRAIG